MAQVLPFPISPAKFKASLVDNNGNVSISANSVCGQMTITDSSNYTTNQEPGHSQVRFQHFRRILIEHYKGTIINLSSLGDGDVTIPAAATGIQTFIQNITTGDGPYRITLRTVPSWNSGDNYQAFDDVVFLSSLVFPNTDKFYKALTNNINTQPNLNVNDWQEIAETDLPVKYATSLFVYLDCALLNCLAQATEAAMCVINDAFCDADLLCNNKAFLKAMKLQLLYYQVQLAVQAQDQDKADNAADLINQICQC